MIPYDFVQNFLMEHFTNVTSKGMDFVARCSLCGDSAKNPRKRRFNLKYKSDGTAGTYHCFNCGASGTFVQLYAQVKGLTKSEAYGQIRRSAFKNIKASLSKPKKTVPEQLVIPDNFNAMRKDWLGLGDTPKGAVQTEFQARLKSFLYKRCLPESYPFYIGIGGPTKGRIIVPIFDRNDDILYYQARSLDSSATQKYMNPTLTTKKAIILNEHRFARDKYIVVVEGPIDAICVGDQGTCVFGASVDDVVLGRLRSLTDKGVVIALDSDSDGLRGTKKIMDKSRYAKSLFYFTMPYTDVKDINQWLMEYRRTTDVYTFVLQNSRNYLEHRVRLGLV